MKIVLIRAVKVNQNSEAAEPKQPVKRHWKKTLKLQLCNDSLLILSSNGLFHITHVDLLIVVMETLIIKALN